MWQELLTLLTCTFIKYVSSKQCEWCSCYSSFQAVFLFSFDAYKVWEVQINLPFTHMRMVISPWQPEITQLPVPVVNRLLLQSVSSGGLCLLENWKTETSVTLLMDQSLLFHHTCQSSLHCLRVCVCRGGKRTPCGGVWKCADRKTKGIICFENEKIWKENSG